MNRLALGLVFVTADAGRGIGLRVERDWMLFGCGMAGEHQHQETGQRD
jgi:hypothetical protein